MKLRYTPEALRDIGEADYATSTRPFQREPEQREGQG